MDVFSTLGGQRFVWDHEEAESNQRRHGIDFGRAREAFFDPLARYENAGTEHFFRGMCTGETWDERLLYVIHIARADGAIRIISARGADTKERRRHENGI